jgi:hypothetical protein
MRKPTKRKLVHAFVLAARLRGDQPVLNSTVRRLKKAYRRIRAGAPGRGLPPEARLMSPGMSPNDHTRDVMREHVREMNRNRTRGHRKAIWRAAREVTARMER